MDFAYGVCLLRSCHARGPRMCLFVFVCVDGVCMVYVHMFVLTVYVNFVCGDGVCMLLLGW